MPEREQGKPKREDEVVDGEILAELPDETLVTLPPVPGEKSEHLGVPRITDEPVDTGRRQLLVRLALGGAAALALGGSAALLLRNQADQRVVVLPNGAQIKSDGTLDVAQLVQQIDSLQTELSSVKTERDGLTSQLQAANNELTQLRPQLQNAQALNALWDQLDAVGLDDLLGGALQTAANTFATVAAVTGVLQTGITDVQASLDQFIKNLPGPKAGLQWLQGQAQALSTNLQNLGTQVQQAVEPVQPYAQMIANFVNWVLDRLPFGVGDKAKAGLSAMNSIVGGLPAIVDGINQQVMNPLIVWFGDDNVRNLYGLLLDPVSKKLLDPARGVETQMASFQDAFTNKLVTPAQTALSQRSGISKQISDLKGQIKTSAPTQGAS